MYRNYRPKKNNNNRDQNPHRDVIIIPAEERAVGECPECGKQLYSVTSLRVDEDNIISVPRALNILQCLNLECPAYLRGAHWEQINESLRPVTVTYIIRAIKAIRSLVYQSGMGTGMLEIPKGTPSRRYGKLLYKHGIWRKRWGDPPE